MNANPRPSLWMIMAVSLLAVILLALVFSATGVIGIGSPRAVQANPQALTAGQVAALQGAQFLLNERSDVFIFLPAVTR